MAPIDLLCITVALTAGTASLYAAIDARRRRGLRALAAKWDMHFSARDPFRLASRIAPRLTVPGAASVRLRDLIYGIEGDFYRYYFTVEYTLHAISARSRLQHVATFVEPRASRESQSPLSPVLWESGDAISLREQYIELHRRNQPKAQHPSTDAVVGSNATDTDVGAEKGRREEDPAARHS